MQKFCELVLCITYYVSLATVNYLKIGNKERGLTLHMRPVVI
jgi:hypothetical protein